MRLTICLGILFFALLAPGAMAADNCAAPPGTSGIDEYCEVLPAPGGTSHHGGGGHGGQKKDQVPPSTRKALQKLGDNGAAVLALTQNAPTAPTGTTQNSAPAPTTTHHSQGKHHSQPGGSSQTSGGTTTTAQSTPQTSAAPAPAAPASNPASAVGDSFGGSLGAGFLALLAGIAVVMALVAWLGRRRGPGSAQA